MSPATTQGPMPCLGRQVLGKNVHVGGREVDEEVEYGGEVEPLLYDLCPDDADPAPKVSSTSSFTNIRSIMSLMSKHKYFITTQIILCVLTVKVSSLLASQSRGLTTSPASTRSQIVGAHVILASVKIGSVLC